jgi:lipopolysaccharide assembly protein A
MQFLRTLFWVILAVFLAIMARNNWSDVTLNLWGNLQLDIKVPLLIAIAFLAGFVPPFVILRGRLWTLKRRMAVQGGPAELLANPPAPTGTTDA